MTRGNYGGRPPEKVGRLRRFLGWVGGHELAVLVAVALLAIGVWAFAELADAVIDQEAGAFDRKVLLSLRTPLNPADPIGPRWFEEMVRDFTALGGAGVLTFISFAVAGYLLLERKLHAALLLAGAVAGGALLSILLKTGFDRPRPGLVPHISYTITSSFPSGHAMMAAIVYLTLGALLARVQSRRTLKAYLFLLSLLLTLTVGLSRVYLGVHWPTDVLAGWAGGAVWALLCWLVARWLQRRGKVEEEAPGE